VLEAAHVDAVDGNDDIAGLKAQGLAQGLKVHLKMAKNM
jgi:hypothetical protein